MTLRGLVPAIVGLAAARFSWPVSSPGFWHGPLPGRRVKHAPRAWWSCRTSMKVMVPRAISRRWPRQRTVVLAPDLVISTGDMVAGSVWCCRAVRRTRVDVAGFPRPRDGAAGQGGTALCGDAGQSRRVERPALCGGTRGLPRAVDRPAAGPRIRRRGRLPVRLCLPRARRLVRFARCHPRRASVAPPEGLAATPAAGRRAEGPPPHRLHPRAAVAVCGGAGARPSGRSRTRGHPAAGPGRDSSCPGTTTPSTPATRTACGMSARAAWAPRRVHCSAASGRCRAR